MEESLNNIKNSEIILVDSNSNVRDILKIQNYELKKIIALDFDSHRSLQSLKIDHEVLDHYLSENDLTDIQNLCSKFIEWYELPIFSKELIFDGVNIGKLFYVEFNYSLVPVITKIYALLNIIKQFPNQSFLTTPIIYELAQCLSISKLIKFGDIGPNSSFLYDTVQVRITNSLSFNLSRTNYLKIKNFVETFLVKLVQQRISKNKKTFL